MRLEDRHGSHVIRGQSTEELAAEEAAGARLSLWHYPMFGRPQEVEVPPAVGGHGGGDELLLEQLFSPDPPPDPLGRAATLDDGLSALALGLAANESVATGGAVVATPLLGAWANVR